MTFKFMGKELTPKQLQAIRPVIQLRLPTSEYQDACLKAMKDAGVPFNQTSSSSSVVPTL